MASRLRSRYVRGVPSIEISNCAPSGFVTVMPLAQSAQESVAGGQCDRRWVLFSAGLLAVKALNLACAHSFCGDHRLSLSGRVRLQALKLSLLFRNTLVQVLALKLCKLGSEQLA
jgi:hypothetical protein